MTPGHSARNIKSLVAAGLSLLLAGAATAQTGTSSLEQRAGEFVAQLPAIWSDDAAAVLPALQMIYADQVEYYGKMIDLPRVLEDKETFISGWPQRSYRNLPGTLSVGCDAERRMCIASGLLEWVTTNSQKQTSGIARYRFGIDMAKDRPLIFAEGGEIVKTHDTPASATGGITFWDHNGSVVYLIADGATREFRYHKARSGMVEVGARPDALLFSGKLVSGVYGGTANIFSSRCGAVPYRVEGPISDNDQRVVLRGQAPRIGENCQIRGSFPDVLEFSRINEMTYAVRGPAP